MKADLSPSLYTVNCQKQCYSHLKGQKKVSFTINRLAEAREELIIVKQGDMCQWFIHSQGIYSGRIALEKHQNSRCAFPP